MYKRTGQIIGFFGWMMQIVNWSDLLDRAFRPLIKASQSGLIEYSHLCRPVLVPTTPSQPKNHIDHDIQHRSD